MKWCSKHDFLFRGGEGAYFKKKNVCFNLIEDNPLQRLIICLPAYNTHKSPYSDSVLAWSAVPGVTCTSWRWWHCHGLLISPPPHWGCCWASCSQARRRAAACTAGAQLSSTCKYKLWFLVKLKKINPWNVVRLVPNCKDLWTLNWHRSWPELQRERHKCSSLPVLP